MLRFEKIEDSPYVSEEWQKRLSVLTLADDQRQTIYRLEPRSVFLLVTSLDWKLVDFEHVLQATHIQNFGVWLTFMVPGSILVIKQCREDGSQVYVAMRAISINVPLS